MTLAQLFSIALAGLSANKMRTALTMLGIIIGVAAVIVLMAIGSGTTASVTSRITALGSNLIFVRPGSAQPTGAVRQAQGSASTLTLPDAQAIAAEGAIPSVQAVSAESQTRSQVIAGGLNVSTTIHGVEAPYLGMRNYQIGDGDFFTQTNIDSKALVAVLGSTNADTLFPNGNAVGSNIRMNNLTFKVVGTLVSKGGTGFGNDDDVILIPITTFIGRLSSQRTNQGAQSVQTINVQVSNEKLVAQAKDDIAALLRERHKIIGDDDFTVTSQEDTLATLSQVTGVMTAFLGSIAGISLLVGGIGVMNIMLVSVTERTREIGIRKAVGAKRMDILAQFLVEAMVMSVLGGAAGLGLGVGISRLVSGVNINGSPLNAVVSWDVALLAVSVSAAIGLFFGIYPAFQASKLNPIQALRYE